MGLTPVNNSRPRARSEGSTSNEKKRAPAIQPSFNIRVVSEPPDGPRILEIENFVSAADAESLIRIGGINGLYRSKIIGTHGPLENMNESEMNVRLGERESGGSVQYTASARTSETAWYNTRRQQTHPVVKEFERKVQLLLECPEVTATHSPDNSRPCLTRSRADRENLQLIHYEVGQMYRLHYDKVERKRYDSDVDGQRKATTRAATLLTYLNTPALGGETHFPYARSGMGLDIVPVMGKAILFWNQNDDGTLDKKSRHEAKPVRHSGIVDEKFAITAWLQECEDDCAASSKLDMSPPASNGKTGSPPRLWDVFSRFNIRAPIFRKSF